MKTLISLFLVISLVCLVSCKSNSKSDTSNTDKKEASSSNTSKDKWGGDTKEEFMSDRSQIHTFQEMLRELGYKGEEVYKYDKVLMECYYDGSTQYLEKLFPNGPVSGVNHRYSDLGASTFDKIITPCLNKIKKK